MVGFKKKLVSADRVATVEAAASSAPIVGDPRMAAPQTPKLEAPVSTPSKNLGSSQDVRLAQNGPFEPGRVYDISVGILRSNPFNPRAVYTSTAVDEMAQSLAASGQRISATGYVSETGEVVLIEGETRLRGARAAGLPTLRVEIKPKPASDRELYEEARAANVERREQTPLDDAIRWKELLTKKLYPTQSALAKAMGLGEDHVSRTLSLASLPGRVVHALVEAPELLSFKMLNAIREYWEVKDDESTLELVSQAVKTGMGYRDVVARRNAAMQGPIKRTRSSSESITFRGAKGVLKSFDEAGRVELSLTGLTAEAAQELTSKLMALFPKG
jgi:ParB family chromosome partitioning protein